MKKSTHTKTTIKVTSYQYVISRIEIARITNYIRKAELGHESIEVHVYRIRFNVSKIAYRYKVGLRIGDTAYETHDEHLEKTPIKAINLLIAQYWAEKAKEMNKDKLFKFNYSEHDLIENEHEHAWETAEDDLRQILTPEQVTEVKEYYMERRQETVETFNPHEEVQEVIDFELTLDKVSDDWRHVFGRGIEATITSPHCESDRAQEIGKTDEEATYTIEDKKDFVAAYVNIDNPQMTMTNIFNIFASDNSMTMSERMLMFPAYTLFVSILLNIGFVGKGIINLCRPVTVAKLIGNKLFKNLQKKNKHETKPSGHSIVGFACLYFLKFFSKHYITGRAIIYSKDLDELGIEVGTGRFSLYHHFRRDHDEAKLTVDKFAPMVWKYVIATLMSV